MDLLFLSKAYKEVAEKLSSRDINDVDRYVLTYLLETILRDTENIIRNDKDFTIRKTLSNNNKQIIPYNNISMLEFTIICAMKELCKDVDFINGYNFSVMDTKFHR